MENTNSLFGSGCVAIISDIYKDGLYWVQIEPVGKASRYYGSLGYELHREKDKWGRLVSPRGVKLLVKLDDLMSNSPVIVTKICDECEKQIKQQKYCDVVRRRPSTDGKDRCKDCARKFALYNRENNRSLNENMWITNPKLANQLLNPKEGLKYSQASNQKVDWKCVCGNIIKNKTISYVKVQGLFCPKCSDGLSYPEKFVANVLGQLKVDFEFQKTFKWSGKKRYDFFISKQNCVIETHGIQHYTETFSKMGGRSLKAERENDVIKHSLAQTNGINHYIVLNCSNSEMEFIKNNILQSNLTKIFDFSKIDWSKCHEYACSSLVVDVCNLWNNQIKNIKEISTLMKLSDATIRTYLKAGASAGWCDYDVREEKTKTYHKAGKRKERCIVRLTKDGIYIDEFTKMLDAKEIFSIPVSRLVDVCNGTRKTAGGYRWMYKEDYEKLSI